MQLHHECVVAVGVHFVSASCLDGLLTRSIDWLRGYSESSADLTENTKKTALLRSTFALSPAARFSLTRFPSSLFRPPALGPLVNLTKGKRVDRLLGIA